MSVYYPAAYLHLGMPDFAQNSVALTSHVVPVRKVELTRDDHNHADTLSVSLAWRDAGVDPRLLRNCTATLCMGMADKLGGSIPNTPRFTGILTKAKRSVKDDDMPMVDLEFHDYTHFFLVQKPVSAAATPNYNDTLEDAWKKLCDNVGFLDEEGNVISAVEALRDRLVLRGLARDIRPGSQVSSRVAKLGMFGVKPGVDAWALWKALCASYGLITYIDLDQCIVTDATSLYEADNAPLLVWGKNLSSLEESADVGSQPPDTGIGLVSFDPLTGTTIEAFWPPLGTKARGKHTVARKSHGKHVDKSGIKYEFQSYPGVTDPDVLTAVARGAWEERSRQELQGQLSTSDPFAYTSSAAYRPNDRVGDVDLLELRAGDSIKVELDPADSGRLSSLTNEGERVAYLIDRGYSAATAAFLARQSEAIDRLSGARIVKRVRTTLDVDGDAGNFEIAINFCNRIDPRKVSNEQ